MLHSALREGLCPGQQPDLARACCASSCCMEGPAPGEGCLGLGRHVLVGVVPPGRLGLELGHLQHVVQIVPGQAVLLRIVSCCWGLPVCLWRNSHVRTRAVMWLLTNSSTRERQVLAMQISCRPRSPSARVYTHIHNASIPECIPSAMHEAACRQPPAEDVSHMSPEPSCLPPCLRARDSGMLTKATAARRVRCAVIIMKASADGYCKILQQTRCRPVSML